MFAPATTQHPQQPSSFTMISKTELQPEKNSLAEHHKTPPLLLITTTDARCALPTIT
jgi:hypothetical protein